MMNLIDYIASLSELNTIKPLSRPVALMQLCCLENNLVLCSKALSQQEGEVDMRELWRSKCITFRLRMLKRSHLHTHNEDLRHADTIQLNLRGINTTSVHSDRLQRQETLERDYLLWTNYKAARPLWFHVVSGCGILFFQE